MAAEVPDVTVVTPLTKLPDLELEIIDSEEISLTPTMWVGSSPYYHAFASGGYADIYKATRISDGRAKAVVVKVFRNAHLQTTNVYEKHKYINRLRREYGVWSILQHRNIHVLEGIVVKEVLASAGLVSEYKPWGSLETFLKSGPTASFGRLCMGQGITCGLKYLHDNGIVHGDLTVANVLVDEDLDGTLFPKISDFGKSRLLERDGYTTRVGEMPVVYRPPELLMHSGEEMPYNKEVLSPQSDVYSLALLLLEALTHCSSPIFLPPALYWKKAILPGMLTQLHAMCRYPSPHGLPPPVSGKVPDGGIRHGFCLAHSPGMLEDQPS